MVDYKAKYAELLLLCNDFVNKVIELENRETMANLEKEIQDAGGLTEYFNKLAAEKEMEFPDDTTE